MKDQNLRGVHRMVTCHRISIFNLGFVFGMILSSTSFATNAEGPYVHTTAERSIKTVLGSKSDETSVMVDLDTYQDMQEALAAKIWSSAGGQQNNRGPWQTKVDHFVINREGSPVLDIIEELEPPVGINFHRNSDVIFAQAYRKTEGRPASHHLADLPFTAEIAKRRLHVGDFVAFESEMDLRLSANLGVSIVPFLEVGALGAISARGQFQVHVLRLNDNRVRVKLAAVNNKNSTVGVGIGPSVGIGDSLKFVGISVDHVSTTFTDLQLAIYPLELKFNNNTHALSFADLEFDLSDSNGAAAYNALMGANLRLQSIPYRNPLLAREYGKVRFHDLMLAESLAKKDSQLPREKRRVTSHNNGSAIGKRSGTEARIDIGIFSFDEENSTATNRITVATAKADTEKFLLNSVLSSTEHGAIFGLNRDRQFHEMSYLYRADSQFRAKELQTISIAFEQNLSPLKSEDIGAFYLAARAQLPKDLADSLDDSVRGEKFKFANADHGFFHWRFSFATDALKRKLGGDYTAIAERFTAYLKSRDLSKIRSAYGPNSIGDIVNGCNNTDCLQQDIAYISYSLMNTLRANISEDYRKESFANLIKIDLFKNYGAGFLLGLLNKEDYDVSFIISSDSTPALSQQFGELFSSQNQRENGLELGQLLSLFEPQALPIFTQMR
jgi:hypothetical protein